MQPTDATIPDDTIGSRIRNRRLELKLSQDAIARPEFTKSYISAVERNKVRPSLKALQFIAKRLGVPARDLLAEPPTAEEIASQSEQAYYCWWGEYQILSEQGQALTAGITARLDEIATLDAAHPDFPQAPRNSPITRDQQYAGWYGRRRLLQEDNDTDNLQLAPIEDRLRELEKNHPQFLDRLRPDQRYPWQASE